MLAVPVDVNTEGHCRPRITGSTTKSIIVYRVLFRVMTGHLLDHATAPVHKTPAAPVHG
jgi:hypothetical protein